MIKPQYIEYHLDLIIQIQIVLDDVECLTLAGDFPLDFPLPWMSGDPVQWHRALHRATQVHQLLRPSLRIHASPVYTVQSRLSAIQNKVACWKAEVFQVYMIGSNYSSSYAFLNKRGMVSTHNFFSYFFFYFSMFKEPEMLSWFLVYWYRQWYSVDCYSLWASC